MSISTIQFQPISSYLVNVDIHSVLFSLSVNFTFCEVKTEIKKENDMLTQFFLQIF